MDCGRSIGAEWCASYFCRASLGVRERVRVVVGMCRKAHECVGGLGAFWEKDECIIALAPWASAFEVTLVWPSACGECSCMGEWRECE